MRGDSHFHEEIGLVTLQRLKEANRFNEWLFSVIAPYLNGHVLEIGSGIGNLSELFLKHQIKLTVSEISPAYFGILEKRLSIYPSLMKIMHLDIEMNDVSGESE